MPDYPDWQPQAFVIGDPIVNLAGQVVVPQFLAPNAPFALNDWDSLAVWLEPAGGTARIRVSFDPVGSPFAGNVPLSLTVRNTEQGYVVWPIAGDRINEIAFDGSVAGTTVNAMVWGTSRQLGSMPPSGAGAGNAPMGILRYQAGVAIGIGGNFDFNLGAYQGRARYEFVSTASAWTLEGRSFDFTGAQQGLFLRRSGVGLDDRGEMILPSGENRVNVLNTGGVAGAVDLSVVVLPRAW